MQCDRCQGLMVVDYCFDHDNSGALWFSVWRCVICGEVVDRVIQFHRLVQQAGELHEPVRSKVRRSRRTETAVEL